MFFCQTRGQNHPQREELQQTAMQMLATAAVGQGIAIDTPDAFDTWFREQQLNDASVFIPQLNRHLEDIIGDQWLFDPQLFS